MGDASSAFQGGLTGAAIGSGISPGLGTAIGGGAGLIIGGMTDMFGGGDDMEKLARRQKELAAEFERQRQQTYQGRIQALGQSAQALAPYNRLVGQMVGPEAAFTGEQVANMTADPKGGPSAPYPWIKDAYERGVHLRTPQEFQEYMPYSAGAQGPLKEDIHRKLYKDWQALQDYAEERRRYETGEQQRRAGVEQAFAPASPGAPRQQTTEAAAAPKPFARR